MSDEIKEILDRLEIVARKHTIKVCEDGSKIETMPASVIAELRLNNYSAKLLLDYITNLQKTQETLIKNDKEIITNLQEENKRLKELCDKYEEEHSTKFNEWVFDKRENERLNDIIYGKNEYIKMLEKSRDDYKSRCEKAIEYLNNLTNYRFEFTFDNVDRHEIVGCTHNFVKDLLNILNGGDK